MKIYKKRINLTWIPLVIGLLGIGGFIYLSTISQDFELAGYIVMIVVSLVIALYGVHVMKLYRKKKKIIESILKPLEVINDFNIRMKEAALKDDSTEYDELFLEAERSDNENSRHGLEVLDAMTELGYPECREIFFQWYNNPSCIDEFLKSYQKILKDLSAQFKEMPPAYVRRTF